MTVIDIDATAVADQAAPAKTPAPGRTLIYRIVSGGLGATLLALAALLLAGHTTAATPGTTTPAAMAVATTSTEGTVL